MKRSAFSIIEISIVLLIVGIIVVGATYGKSLIDSSKFQKVKRLTSNSPVKFIEGLLVWMETTSKNSFDTTYVDNDNVASWDSINVQTTNKYRFIANNTPKFQENEINTLPIIEFNGSDVFDGLQTNFAQLIGKGITIFLVAKTNTEIDNVDYVSSWLSNGADKSFRIYQDAGANIRFRVSADGSANSADATLIGGVSANPKIITAMYDGTQILIDSSQLAQVTTAYTGGIHTQNAGLRIGRSSVVTFNGQIGEVIIFGRSLNSEERSSVELYLSQKWGIKYVL